MSFKIKTLQKLHQLQQDLKPLDVHLPILLLLPVEFISSVTCNSSLLPSLTHLHAY